MNAVRYILEIRKEANLYEGRIHQGDPEESCYLPDLALSDDSEVAIKGQLYKLSDLMDRMIEYDLETVTSIFDERGQLQLGQHLYAETFGRLNEPERERLRGAEFVDLRIVTADENIGRLPWALLADAGVFLSADGWSIALSSHQKYQDYTLPPSLVILLVLPQPVDRRPTDAERHRAVLEAELSGHKIWVARTWEEFVRLSAEFAPQVIYYYGHGTGDWSNSRLSFADETHNCLEKPIADVATFLRQQAGSPPRLVYLNCCYGDAGGILGAGRQLGTFVPAVVTNSTAAHINAAQKQGLCFLRSVLLKGTPPHTAIAEMRANIVGLDLSFRDLQWMTPVLHCHYDRWIARLRRPRSRLARNPYWHLRINRSGQFSIVHYDTTQMMKQSSPRGLAYVWYGEEDQGVSIFNQRLEVELRELASGSSLCFRRIDLDWPMHFDDPGTDFEYMFTAALRDRNIESIDDIPHCIASEFHGKEKPTLLYISNKHPLRPSVVQPGHLKRFLEWWENRFVGALTNTQMFPVLGLSFVLKNVEQDRVRFKKSGISNWYFERIIFKVLAELDSLVVKDLIECLMINQIELPADRLKVTLTNILSRSMGRYEPTVEMLSDVEQVVWTYDLKSSEAGSAG